MADVFVSYKSEDRAHAERIAKALQEDGLSVWWDPALEAGQDYQQVIDENLRRALVVVVLWSTRSVQSRWVRSEATIGDRYGALAPVMIEPCERPVAFELLQTSDLSNWSGDASDAAWQEFSSDVQRKVEQKRSERSAPGAKPEPDAVAIETVFWESIQHSNDPADFRAYVQRYPKGHFTPLARNRLNALSHGKRGRGGAGGWVLALLAVVALGVAGVLLAPRVSQLRTLTCYVTSSGPFCGRYEGELTESQPGGELKYAVVADFTTDANDNPAATIGYWSDQGVVECGGAWEFMWSDRNRWVFRETITAAPSGSCVSGAIVVLTKPNDGPIGYEWKSSMDEEATVRGALRRTWTR